MRTLKYPFEFLFLALVFAACTPGDRSEASEGAPTYGRIISLSGALTETLFALGHGDRVVGVDVTSTYPEAAQRLPRLGHVSQLNAEGLLGLRPDLIIAEAGERENEVLAQVRGAGVEVLFVDKPHSLEAPLLLARTITDKLGEQGQTLEALKQAIESQKEALAEQKRAWTDNPRVLFIYARGKGNMMVAGRGTSAEAMIEAAGGQNAVTAFEDFRALSAEGLIEAQPDVLLLFESGLQSLEGMEQLLALPGIDQTPAGRKQRVIAMDGHYLLGFGPRTVEAAIELNRQLRGEISL